MSLTGTSDCSAFPLLSLSATKGTFFTSSPSFFPHFFPRFSQFFPNCFLIRAPETNANISFHTHRAELCLSPSPSTQNFNYHWFFPALKEREFQTCELPDVTLSFQTCNQNRKTPPINSKLNPLLSSPSRAFPFPYLSVQLRTKAKQNSFATGILFFPRPLSLRDNLIAFHKIKIKKNSGTGLLFAAPMALTPPG